MIRLYTTPQFLRDVGFDLTQVNLNEAGIYNVIHEVSSIIDSLTDQWFNAEAGTYFFNGSDRELIQHPKQLPFVRVTSVGIVGDRTNYRNRSFSTNLYRSYPEYDQAKDGPYRSALFSSGTGTIQPIEYAVHNRAIERIRAPFPGGARNIQVVGALGVVEEPKFFTTTTTVQITGSTTFFGVADISGLEYRDVIDVTSDAGSFRAIVLNVNRASGNVTLTDRLGGRFIPEAIPAGATVTTYGKVPRGIEMVANYLVGNALQEISSRQNANANPIDPARIKREETDDYEYELFSASEARSLITGRAKFDTILQAFTRPGGVRVI